MVKFLKSVSAFIILGLLLGLFLPEFGKKLEILIIPSLFILMFYASIKLDRKKLASSFKDKKLFVISLVSIYIVIPSFTVGLAYLIRIDPVYIPGVIFAAIAPPIASVPFFSKKLGGDVELSYLLSAIPTFLFPILAPIILLITCKMSLEIDIFSTLKMLLFIVVGPFLLSMVMKKLCNGLIITISNHEALVTKICFFAFMYPTIAINNQYLFTFNTTMFHLLAISFFQEIGVFFFFMQCVLRNVKYEVRRTLSLVFSVRNTALTAGIALTVSPEFAIPSALVVLIHVPMFIIIDLVEVSDTKKKEKNLLDVTL